MFKDITLGEKDANVFEDITLSEKEVGFWVLSSALKLCSLRDGYKHFRETFELHSLFILQLKAEGSSETPLVTM
jgi:hypothetical protein